MKLMVDDDTEMVAIVNFEPRLPDSGQLRDRIKEMIAAVDGLPEGTVITIKVTRSGEA